MKIRADFVTNSSSSSYLCVSFTCKAIADILNRYQEFPQTEIFDEIDGNSYCLRSMGAFDPETACPKKESEMADQLIEFLWELCNRYDVSEATTEQLVKELQNSKEDIRQTLNSLDWQYTLGLYGDSAEYDEDDEVIDDGYTVEASYDGKTFTYSNY